MKNKNKEKFNSMWLSLALYNFILFFPLKEKRKENKCIHFRKTGFIRFITASIAKSIKLLLLKRGTEYLRRDI
jgi:hypothetical protein